MKRLLLTAVVGGACFHATAELARAQGEARRIEAILKEEIVPVDVAAHELRSYLLARVAKPPVITDKAAWASERDRIRRHLLGEVVFHGWPEAWVTSPPHFEQTGVIEADGYRIRKFRYEILPGFYSVALLYEPANPGKNMPAILNVNGHDFEYGKAAEYKQKRCINFARHGILALNLEWLGCGELHVPANSHWSAGQLDLAGLSGVGVFYLNMRKGLDYLYDLPSVDRARIGMTGLSGGGWQTIMLSSLDERVGAAVPVAGFSSVSSRIEVNHYGDVGDVEQSATDLLDGYDFTHLMALRAPRPTLLAYNAEDDCCFRASVVKPLVYDAIKPIYEQYGAADSLQWHESRDPGSHNYQIDNRTAAYKFFSQQFHLPLIDSEPGVDAEVRPYEALVVGLPPDNLTMMELAKRTMRENASVRQATGAQAAESQRKLLAHLIRYKTVSPERVWTVGITKNRGIESRSYLYHMNNGLSATGIWLKAMSTPELAPAAIVLNDVSKSGSAKSVAERITRGEQVIAVDLAFMSKAWQDSGASDYEQIVGGMGERPLGIEVAQLIAIAKNAKTRSSNGKVALETQGFRSQTVALIAAALEPDLFSALAMHGGMSSLSYLLEKPVGYEDAPDLFCLDLFKYFDVDSLTRLASPVAVSNIGALEAR
jgi:dienelactone hydrolase